MAEREVCVGQTGGKTHAHPSVVANVLKATMSLLKTAYCRVVVAYFRPPSSYLYLYAPPLSLIYTAE